MPAKLLKWPNKQKMTKKEEINKKYNIQKKKMRNLIKNLGTINRNFKSW